MKQFPADRLLMRLGSDLMSSPGIRIVIWNASAFTCKKYGLGSQRDCFYSILSTAPIVFVFCPSLQKLLSEISNRIIICQYW